MSAEPRVIDAAALVPAELPTGSVVLNGWGRACQRQAPQFGAPRFDGRSWAMPISADRLVMVSWLELLAIGPVTVVHEASEDASPAPSIVDELVTTINTMVEGVPLMASSAGTEAANS